MSRLTASQRVRLGAFVLGTLFILAISVAALAGVSLGRPRLMVRARFTDSVSGLERNAPVRYQGLRIGRVESLRIAADAPQAIEVVMGVDPSVPLFVGTTAVLDQTGLTGLKAINLTPGDPSRPRLQAGALLPATGAALDRFIGHATAIAADVRAVADQVGHLVTDDTRHRLEHLIGGLDAFVHHLDAVVDAPGQPLQHTLAHVDAAAQALVGTASETQRAVHIAAGRVDGVADRLERALDAIATPLEGLPPGTVARALEAVAHAAHAVGSRLGDAEAGRTITELNRTLGHVDRLVQDTDLAVRAGREDVTHTLGALRQAADDVREFSRQMAENPAVLLRGRNSAE